MIYYCSSIIIFEREQVLVAQRGPTLPDFGTHAAAAPDGTRLSLFCEIAVFWPKNRNIKRKVELCKNTLYHQKPKKHPKSHLLEVFGLEI